MTRKAGRPATLGPLTGLVLTGPLGAWLAVRAVDAGGALAGAAWQPGDVAEVVSAALLWTGCAAAVWYFVTCAAVVGVHLARATGAGTASLERAVRRWGFPLLRRALLSTVATGAGLSLAVGAAAAAQSPNDAEIPRDLGWGGSIDSAALSPVGTRTAEVVWPAAEAARSAPPPARTGTGTGPEPPTARTATEEPSTPAASPPATERRTDQAVAAAQAASAPRVSAPSPPDATATPGDPSSGAGPTTYRVRPGDSLWSIARAHLGPDAQHAEVAHAWPRWYAANRSGVGPDPHLIHPGQLLQVPNEEAS